MGLIYLEMSRDYAEKTRTSEYFYLDDTDDTEMHDGHPQNKGFLGRHKLIVDGTAITSIIPLNKFSFLVEC